MRKSVITRRYPNYEEEDLIKGQWSFEEDEILIKYIKNNGPGRWNLIPKRAGLHRCPKSIRMRWVNYLRADINRGPFTLEEENIIINMQSTLGNRWSTIASHLPGRTDNQIKNHWTTHLKKRCMRLEQPHHVPPSDLGQHHINGSATIKSEDNNLLTMWNSEIGESFRRLFRNNNSNAAATLTSTCYGPMSLASSSSMVMGAGPPDSAMSTNRHETDINTFFNLDSSSSSNPTPGNEFDWIRGILD